MSCCLEETEHPVLSTVLAARQAPMKSFVILMLVYSFLETP